MTVTNKISYQAAKRDFSYDPETGVLTWKKGKWAGRVAGSMNGCGYITVTWLGKKWYVHRIIATLMLKKDIGGMVIDHRDYDRSNNVWQNIDVVTARQNVLRRRIRKRKLRYQGIERRDYSYGVRYRATLVANGRKFVGTPQRTQKAAYHDYLSMFVEHASIYDLPPRLASDFVMSQS